MAHASVSNTCHTALGFPPNQSNSISFQPQQHTDKNTLHPTLCIKYAAASFEWLSFYFGSFLHNFCLCFSQELASCILAFGSLAFVVTYFNSANLNLWQKSLPLTVLKTAMHITYSSVKRNNLNHHLV